MDDLRVDVKILHKNGSIIELINNVLLIDKRKMAVKFVGPEDVEKIYEFWRMEEGPLEATTNYDGDKQMSIRIDEGAAEEIILKLIFKPPHNLMAGYVATLLNSLLELEKCSQNQRKKFQETEVIVNATIIQKVGEPLILKSRQLLIEPNSKSLQLLFGTSKIVERKYQVEQMRGKVKSPKTFGCLNRVLTIELKNSDSDLQINLLFLPPHEMMADLVGSLLNEMIRKEGAESLEIQDEPSTSDVAPAPPKDPEIIADITINLKDFSIIDKPSCQLNLDVPNRKICFKTADEQNLEFQIAQFVRRDLPQLRKPVVFKPVNFTLCFSQRHESNQNEPVKNSLRICLKPPYNQFAKQVKEHIIQMFEAENNEKDTEKEKEHQIPISSPEAPPLSVSQIAPALRALPELRVELTIIKTPYSVTKLPDQRIFVSRASHFIQFESADGEIRSFDGRQMVNCSVKHPNVLSVELYDSAKGNMGHTQLKILFRLEDQKMVTVVEGTFIWMLYMNKQGSAPQNAPNAPSNSRKRPSSGDSQDEVQWIDPNDF